MTYIEYLELQEMHQTYYNNLNKSNEPRTSKRSRFLKRPAFPFLKPPIDQSDNDLRFASTSSSEATSLPASRSSIGTRS